MTLSKDNFTSMFSMLMHREPTPDEIDTLFPLTQGIPEDAVCIIGQLPEFVRKHPSFIPVPLTDALESTTRNGFPINVPMHDWVHADRSGEFEPWVADAMRQVLKPGSVFVDVGANIGVHTVAGAHLVGETGRVYAMEASIEVASVLLVNARKTGLGNIVIVPVAITDQTHVEQILVSHGTSNRSVHVFGDPRKLFVFEPVLTTTLDTVLSHVERIDLIKVDVEGREGSAFRGAERLLKRFRPKIIAEHHFASPEHWFVEEMIARDYEMTVLSANAPAYVGNDIAALRTHRTNDTYVDVFFNPREEPFAFAETRQRHYSFTGDHKLVRSNHAVRKDGELVIDAPEPTFAMFGPYLGLPAGRYRVTVDLSTGRGAATVNVCHKSGSVVVAEGAGPSLDFALPHGADDLEIRLWVAERFAGTVRQLSVVPLD